jgi:aspartate-semialdehyde dehydrogenase
MSSQKIPVGVLGATGMVGQNFVRLLEDHPLFEVTWVGASDRSAGKKYKEATSWRLEGAMPAKTAELTIFECKPISGAPKLIFSATDASVATEIEGAFAQAGHFVVSNSRNYRMESDVPLLVPEVNSDHLALIEQQRKIRQWPGAIVTNPNCSTVGLTMALAPLKQFGIRQVLVSTMQAVSGAGYPGVASMDILGNVVPFIGGEEEKIEQETQKILGDFESNTVKPLQAAVSAHCNRVPVIDGHTLTISVDLSSKPDLAELKQAIQNFAGLPQKRKLPTAPFPPVLYLEEENRPQPRRDAMRANGMQVTVGRLRSCSILGYKMVALVHNTIRGAAGAAILNAEVLHSEGLL